MCAILKDSQIIPLTSFNPLDPKHIAYPIETGTVANYLGSAMKEAGINTKDYTPHSIRSASSTFAAHLGLTDTEIKVHANWSNDRSEHPAAVFGSQSRNKLRWFSAKLKPLKRY